MTKPSTPREFLEAWEICDFVQNHEMDSGIRFVNKSAYDKAIAALNKIAIYGSGADAYTSQFTDNVNMIVRSALKELGEK